MFEFTYAAFDQFCQQSVHMPVFSLAGILARSTPPPLPYLILHIDVDTREERALQLAQIAAWYGLRGSFYFRCRGSQFPLDAMHSTAALGHEVSFQFELDHGGQTFLKQVAELRAAGHAIQTVSAATRRDFERLRQQPDLLVQADLRGEASLSVNYRQVVYFSDSGWQWRQHDFDGPAGGSQGTTLRHILREAFHPHAALYMNFHAHQWFPHPWSAAFYRTPYRLRRLFRRSS